MLTEEKKEKLRIAARNTIQLLDAFALIIKMPESGSLKPVCLPTIESIIKPARLKIFFEKWSSLEPDNVAVRQVLEQKQISREGFLQMKRKDRDAPLLTDEELAPTGFFAGYIRPSSVKYNPKNYALHKISDCLDIILKKIDNLDINFSFLLKAAGAFEELCKIQRGLMQDGGKNSIKLLGASETQEIYATERLNDRHYAGNRVLKDLEKKSPESRAASEGIKLEELIDTFIREHDIRITSLAIKSRLRPLDYITERNHEINRRKDVLQILVAQIAENMGVIRNTLGSVQMIHADKLVSAAPSP